MNIQDLTCDTTMRLQNWVTEGDDISNPIPILCWFNTLNRARGIYMEMEVRQYLQGKGHLEHIKCPVVLLSRDNHENLCAKWCKNVTTTRI